MVGPFLKDIIREIGGTKGRFISMLIITMLGVMVVVGIHATAIHMRDAADAMYRRKNLYDLQLRHPGGFTAADVAVIKSLPGVRAVMPTFVVDAYFYVRGSRRVMRAHALPPQWDPSAKWAPEAMNLPTITAGRLPERYYEIALERQLLRGGRFNIGDEISLYRPGFFHAGTFTIVGIIDSPHYLTHERGNTTLGGGVVNYYAYLHPAAYTLPVYTDVFLTMEASRRLHQVSEEYNAAALLWRYEMENALRENNISAFVFTRQNGASFESYFQDTNRLERVGYVFPILFFLVAVLVTLTAMTRMVEEQRAQIGIYKALGCKPAAILLKYVVYAFLSGFVGGILGSLFGAKLIPRIIFDAYSHLYQMPVSSHPVPWGLAATAMGAAIASVVGTALITALGTMKGEAAALMRPKAPRAGKRVLLEKIPFIWNGMDFIGKVTARNVFRYKRRFFMTLIGVAGCTALLVTAFGLRDSIGNVSRIQYDTITTFDAQIHMREITDTERAELEQLSDACKLFIRNMTANAHTDAGGFSSIIIIPECMDALPEFIRLIEPRTGWFAPLFVSQTYATTNMCGVFVTEKLAREMNVVAGDYFYLTLGDGTSYSVRAAAVVENFVLHYVFMAPCYHARIFGREISVNSILINGHINPAAFMAHDAVRGISHIAMIRENLREQTDALGIVTILLLITACMLAFVVLFNLTEINILERTRELATIKVLGFHDRETAMYLYRENMVVTIMGTVLGLVGGIALNSFVLTTIEIDLLKFPHLIFPSSFAMAGGLSILFALLVNAATYYKLVRIDMVGALKSVE